MAMLAAGQLAATVPDTTPSCDGRTISAIDINPQRPAFEGNLRRWQQVARAIGLHHTTTRPEVIRAYFLFSEGGACTNARLAETERILRALPFLADASVQALPDSANGVRIVVQTTDEVPVLVSGALRHSKPAAIGLGNANLAGLGVAASAGVADNSPYRTSSWLKVDDYAPLGLPILTSAEAVRDRLGGHVAVGVSHQLLSYLQRTAWNASLRVGDEYPLVVRPVGDDDAVHVRENRWSLGGVLHTSRGLTSLLLGPVVLGTSFSPTGQMLIVADSAPVAVADTAILKRFPAFHAVHAGGLIGARRVHFVTRTGVDALFAPQDVMTGWQLGAVVAPGVGGRDDRDVLFAQSAYLGATTRTFFAFADGESEFRHGTQGGGLASVVNVRGAAYWLPYAPVRITVQDNFSLLRSSVLATQLSMSDVIGGPRGFNGSTLVGGERNVVRTELRMAQPRVIKGADVGAAVFTDFAHLWAGDVPFGTDASGHSIGFSLIGAYPTKSKRTYRIDFAFPVGTGRSGLRSVQIRFTNGDPTLAGSGESGDVTQARLAPVPSTLFAWPGR